jgi:hypothetical protein
MLRALRSARIAHATCAALALAAFAALGALHSWQRMRALEAALLRALAGGSASLASIAGDSLTLHAPVQQRLLGFSAAVTIDDDCVALAQAPTSSKPARPSHQHWAPPPT